jgi:hypothetical protein
MDMPSATPAKSGGKTKKLLMILGIVGAGFILLLFLGVYGIFSAASGPTKAAKSFLETVATEDIAAAYGMTSSAFQEVTPQEDLELFLEVFPVVADSTEIKFNSFSIENGIAIVSGTIYSATENSPITVTLTKEGADWKVVNFSLNPEDVLDFDDETEEEEVESEE